MYLGLLGPCSMLGFDPISMVVFGISTMSFCDMDGPKDGFQAQLKVSSFNYPDET